MGDVDVPARVLARYDHRFARQLFHGRFLSVRPRVGRDISILRHVHPGPPYIPTDDHRLRRDVRSAAGQLPVGLLLRRRIPVDIHHVGYQPGLEVGFGEYRRRTRVAGQGKGRLPLSVKNKTTRKSRSSGRLFLCYREQHVVPRRAGRRFLTGIRALPPRVN